jgi:hypothetical protein
VSEAVCRRHSVLPIAHEDGRLVVAMADPANVFALDDVRLMTGLEVKAVVATRADVLAAIDRHHRGDAEMDELKLAMAVPEQRPPTPRRRRSSRTRRSSSSSTCSSRRPSPTAPRTSTSSRRRRTCGCASASTGSCTR